MNAQPPPPPPPPPSQQPGGDVPSPAQAGYDAPAASPPSGGDEKASSGLRILAAFGVLVIGLAALIGFIAFASIGGTDTCDAVLDGSGTLNSDGECYDGSSGLKTIVTILGFAGSVLLAVAAVMALMFTIRGRGGRPLLYTLGAGVALFGISLIIG